MALPEQKSHKDYSCPAQHGCDIFGVLGALLCLLENSWNCSSQANMIWEHKIAVTFQILSHNARISTKEVKNSRREWKMVWWWFHDAATWMRSDPSREVQLQVDLCSQVPRSQGGLLHQLEFADWCSKTLALPARILISLGSHRILFPACKKLSLLHTSWLHLAPGKVSLRVVTIAPSVNW